MPSRQTVARGNHDLAGRQIVLDVDLVQPPSLIMGTSAGSSNHRTRSAGVDVGLFRSPSGSSPGIAAIGGCRCRRSAQPTPIRRYRARRAARAEVRSRVFRHLLRGPYAGGRRERRYRSCQGRGDGPSSEFSCRALRAGGQSKLFGSAFRQSSDRTGAGPIAFSRAVVSSPKRMTRLP